MNNEMRDAFFNPIVDEALKNKDLIVLAADHTAFSLNKLVEEVPEQFINVGISEQNMISLAAGMALRGKKVFAYGITPFVSLKILEQFTLDVATQNLDVNIVSVGCGFAYSTDGPSHHGLQDIGCMLSIPNIFIYNCSDPWNSSLIAEKSLKEKSPKYIRIEKGNMDNFVVDTKEFNGCSKISSGKDLCILTSGAISHEVLKASKILEERFSIRASIIDIYQLKPLPEGVLLGYISGYSNICVIEENWICSGFSNQLASFILKSGLKVNYMNKGVREGFCYEYGSRDFLWNKFNLDKVSIANEIANWIKG